MAAQLPECALSGFMWFQCGSYAANFAKVWVKIEGGEKIEEEMFLCSEHCAAFAHNATLAEVFFTVEPLDPKKYDFSAKDDED